MNDTTEPTKLTIPTPDIAMRAATAHREAARLAEEEAEQQRLSELFELRSVDLGEVILKLLEKMQDPGVDDTGLLQMILDLLDGSTPSVQTSDSTPLSDEEQEVLDDFRKGRFGKNNKGAYVDSNWREIMYGAKKSAQSAPKAESTPVVEPDPTPEPASEPEKEVPTDSAPVADPKDSDAEEESADESIPQPDVTARARTVEPKETPAEPKAEPTPVVEPDSMSDSDLRVPNPTSTFDPVIVARTAMDNDEVTSPAAPATDDSTKPAKVLPPAAPATDDSTKKRPFGWLLEREPKSGH